VQLSSPQRIPHIGGGQAGRNNICSCQLLPFLFFWISFPAHYGWNNSTHLFKIQAESYEEVRGYE